MYCYFYWYLFRLIVLLKPNFNCSNSFALSSVNKFTAGTRRFVSVNVNVVTWAPELDKTHLLGQVRIRFISLIIEISKVLEYLKLLKYFLMATLFRYLLYHHQLFYLLFFAYKRNTVIIIIRKTNNSAISKSQFISIVMSKTFWCFWIIITVFF